MVLHDRTFFVLVQYSVSSLHRKSKNSNGFTGRCIEITSTNRLGRCGWRRLGFSHFSFIHFSFFRRIGILSAEDDEYRWAGVEDPKVIITTSHDPSAKLKQFSKELNRLIPNSQRINRGNYNSRQIVEACRSNQVTDLILVQETRGVPGSSFLLTVIS